MTEKQKPLLFRGGLSGRVYVATRYRQSGDRYEVIEKFDVTDQYDVLREADEEGSDD